MDLNYWVVGALEMECTEGRMVDLDLIPVMVTEQRPMTFVACVLYLI